MTRMRNTLTVAILFVFIKTGSGLLSQKPQDSVTVIGKSTYFNCSTSEPSKRIQWYHYDVDEAQREAIYRCDNSIEYWYPCYRNGRYVVERNEATGAYNLVIPTVVSSDAGRFLCEVDGDEGMANLTVRVESNPTCVASEICEPYSTAIICIFVIILPTLIVGSLFVFWYLRVYRPKKLNQKATTLIEVGTTEEKDSLHRSASPQAKSEAESTKEVNSLNSPASTQEECNTDPDKKIHTLENELQERICRRNETIKGLRQNDESNKAKINSLQSENDQLKDKVKDLEERLYPKGNIDYAEKSTLVHTIETFAAKEQCKPINSMAILGKELFILHENYSLIEVNDSETFKFVRSWNIEGMSVPMDIASCKIANCLYIILREDNESESQIMKLEPGGKLITKWSTGRRRGRLSTYKTNVIVCLFEKQQINEYSGDGKLIHTVSLSQAVGFNDPWHAIKVTSSHFAVCHGEGKDEQHRVCIVNAQGNIAKELGEWKTKDPRSSGKLNVPICIVEDSERSILVADSDNQRVRLLNCFLKHQRNLLKKEMGLDGYPVRICLDETKGRLFVAVKKESKDDRILIFNIGNCLIDSDVNPANSGTIL